MTKSTRELLAFGREVQSPHAPATRSGIRELAFLGLGIRDELWGQITTIKLQALLYLQLVIEVPLRFNRHDAIFAGSVHSLQNEVRDSTVSRSRHCNSEEVLRGADSRFLN